MAMRLMSTILSLHWQHGSSGHGLPFFLGYKAIQERRHDMAFEETESQSGGSEEEPEGAVNVVGAAEEEGGDKRVENGILSL